MRTWTFDLKTSTFDLYNLNIRFNKPDIAVNNFGIVHNKCNAGQQYLLKAT